jgi:hypothetical protein
MLNFYRLILILPIALAFSCNLNNNVAEYKAINNDTINLQNSDSANIYTLLTSQMSDTVILENFLNRITHQEKVKILTELKTSWDDEGKQYIYYDSNYVFKLRHDDISNSNKQTQNSIFIDSLKSISFKNYHITCYQDSAFHCENYGFNLSNTLEYPKIIEVCNKKFLYANISYWCNGIGCGCFLTFIYDLQTNKPTFIENYRIPYKGFFLSDFNNDNSPDLLVISSTFERKMKGFDFDEFDLRLTPFVYDSGVFKPNFDNQYQRTYGFELYSFTSMYHHSQHINLVYSITTDNWFRQQ